MERSVVHLRFGNPFMVFNNEIEDGICVCRIAERCVERKLFILKSNFVGQNQIQVFLNRIEFK